jgi:flagellar biosynthesis protein FlhF
MELKTFRASTMAACLAEVKNALGKDAVILHTRTHKVGGVMGLGGRQIVEITASPPPSGDRVAARRPVAGTAVRDEFVPTDFSSRVSAAEPPAVAVRPTASAPVTPRPRREHAPASSPPVSEPLSAPSRGTEATERASPPRAVEPPTAASRAAGVAALASPAALAPVSEQARSALQEELASIKVLLGQVLQVSRVATLHAQRAGAGVPAAVLAMGGIPRPLMDLYTRLLEQDVDGSIADELIAHVRDELTADELSDESVVRQTLLRHMAAMTPAVEKVTPASRQPDGRPLTLALVGPTGVGKTTTLAKLAAAYKLRQGRRVGLITADTYRIAAVDQLRTYAEIIGLPLKVVLTPAEILAACQSLADCDAILIDSAGRSQHDATRLDELRRFVDAVAPHETHLVLSATASGSVLTRIAERFAPLAPSRVIFTKLDEAVTLGPLLGVARRIGLKLSYFTTGQEVPDHIELAHPDRLARAILSGELVA